jgi:hypothetical protein
MITNCPFSLCCVPIVCQPFMSNDFHIDNHYIPRMYLKPWETIADRVWTYRILVTHESAPVWKPFSSKSVGHHLHLYTRQSAGKESDELERWFDREFERPAQEPLQKAISDKRLTIHDWKCLISFLAAQDVRTRLVHLQNAAMGGPDGLRFTRTRVGSWSRFSVAGVGEIGFSVFRLSSYSQPLVTGFSVGNAGDESAPNACSARDRQNRRLHCWLSWLRFGLAPRRP